MSSSDGSSLSADEIELGLGLSLGGGGGGRIKQFSATAAWDHRRFLTPKDLPSADPASLCPLRAVSGTKRAADSAAQEAASPPSPAVSQVVGWPPLRAYRINNLVVNQAKPLTRNEDDKLLTGGKSYKLEDTSSKKKAHNCRSNISSASSADDKNGRLGFVKVNVDGLPIGRKVDLNAHASYETLALALEDMFFTPTNSLSSTRLGGKEQARKPLKLLDGLSEFVLTYKDTEGDWMLVGDVPWEMFLGTVRRLRIMRTSEANGLGSRML